MSWATATLRPWSSRTPAPAASAARAGSAGGAAARACTCRPLRRSPQPQPTAHPQISTVQQLEKYQHTQHTIPQHHTTSTHTHTHTTLSSHLVVAGALTLEGLSSSKQAISSSPNQQRRALLAEHHQYTHRRAEIALEALQGRPRRLSSRRPARDEGEAEVEWLRRSAYARKRLISSYPTSTRAPPRVRSTLAPKPLNMAPTPSACTILAAQSRVPW